AAAAVRRRGRPPHGDPRCRQPARRVRAGRPARGRTGTRQPPRLMGAADTAAGTNEGAREGALVASAITNTLADVFIERLRQVAEWGVQSHPSLDSVLVQRVQTLRDAGYPDRYAVGMVERHHAMPRADDARDLCEHRARTGHLSWVDILVEEVAEAIEAAALHGEGDELRAEVVQVAAVAVAWLEAIDARAAGR